MGVDADNTLALGDLEIYRTVGKSSSGVAYAVQ